MFINRKRQGGEMNNQLILLPDLRPSEVEARKPSHDGVCFDEILNELMSEREVSSVKLHRATGIPESTISEYITGKTKHPNIVHAYRIARFFNCTIDYLVFGLGDSDPYYGDLA
jgi:plasmid maintenance system antidote protein VapI